jgi:hypothetical protein
MPEIRLAFYASVVRYKSVQRKDGFLIEVIVEERQNLEGVLSPKSRYLRVIYARNKAGVLCQNCSLKSTYTLGRFHISFLGPLYRGYIRIAPLDWKRHLKVPFFLQKR